MTQAAIQFFRFSWITDLTAAMSKLLHAEPTPHWTEYLRDDVRK